MKTKQYTNFDMWLEDIMDWIGLILLCCFIIVLSP